MAREGEAVDHSAIYSLHEAAFKSQVVNRLHKYLPLLMFLVACLTGEKKYTPGLKVWLRALTFIRPSYLFPPILSYLFGDPHFDFGSVVNKF